MYFAIISNDQYPDETYTSDIYFVKPTLNQLYDNFGDPEDMQQRYYRWCVQVKKITNFKEVHHVAGLFYQEDAWPDDDYVTGGDGYLMDQHQERLTHKHQEKELCGN